MSFFGDEDVHPDFCPENEAFVDKYAPCSWEGYFGTKKNVVTDRGNFCVYITGDSGPLVVLLHGAGYSALTWANFCKSAITLSSSYKFLAVDLRGHGDSVQENEMNWSMDSFAEDVIALIEVLFPSSSFIVVGHSMGGCIGVKLASVSGRVIGLIVIDVAEGVAKDAYPYMRAILQDRPSSFSSISEAIHYVYRTKKTKNLISAKLSVPGQVKEACAEGDGESLTGGVVTWRVDLKPTLDYWDDWFQDLSKKFLDLSCPKMLVLPGKENLDKELLIGQMLGKFQLVIIRSCGHFVQEDEPHELSKNVIAFLKRFFAA